MTCEYCNRTDNRHYSQCPNYKPYKSCHNCSECGEPILIGEEYIINDNGDCAHFECVNYARDLAKFLGYEIKVDNDKER